MNVGGFSDHRDDSDKLRGVGRNGDGLMGLASKETNLLERRAFDQKVSFCKGSDASFPEALLDRIELSGQTGRKRGG